MIATIKKRCPICGHLLEKYTNNGAPLVEGGVCLNCNNSVILPYRYFVSTCSYNSNAMVIRGGKIGLVRASDNAFKTSDIELYLGKEITLKQNAKTGLTFVFMKGFEEEPNDIKTIALSALKAPNLKGVMVIPTRLLKGVKMNE